jgi:hypothetical protein
MSCSDEDSDTCAVVAGISTGARAQAILDEAIHARRKAELVASFLRQQLSAETDRTNYFCAQNRALKQQVKSLKKQVSGYSSMLCIIEGRFE